jgi:hypothetical protein
VWISATTSAPGDEWAVCTDSSGINLANSMSSATDESTSPAGTGTWTAFGTTISIGTMGPTKSIGIWIRRSVSVGAGSYASNSGSITWDGETA